MKYFSLLFFLFSSSYLLAQSPDFPTPEQALKDQLSDQYWEKYILSEYGISMQELKFEQKSQFYKSYTGDLDSYRDKFPPDECRIDYVATGKKGSVSYKFKFVISYRNSVIKGGDVSWMNSWMYYSKESGCFPPEIIGATDGYSDSQKIDFAWKLIKSLKGEMELKESVHGVTGKVDGLKNICKITDVTVRDKDYMESPTKKFWYLKIHGVYGSPNSEGSGYEKYSVNGGTQMDVTLIKTGANWKITNVDIWGYYAGDDLVYETTEFYKNYGEVAAADIINRSIKKEIPVSSRKFLENRIPQIIEGLTKALENPSNAKESLVSICDPSVLDSYIAIISSIPQKACLIEGVSISELVPYSFPTEPAEISLRFRIKREKAISKDLINKYKQAGMSKDVIKSYSQVNESFYQSIKLQMINDNWFLVDPLEMEEEIKF